MGQKLLQLIREEWLTLTIIGVILIAWLFLRTSGDGFDNIQDVSKHFASGQPTVVEFYSNRCSICLVSKPKVDKMERELAGTADVIRLNVKDEVGGTLAAQWGVLGVPTFFVLDGEGNIVYGQAGSPDVSGIIQTVENLITNARE